METPEEKPWNEEQWERFLQQSEARSARYGDLLETLIDHPDRDQIIAKEMGWDWMLEDDGSELEDDFDDDFEDPTATPSDTAQSEPIVETDEDSHADDPFADDPFDDNLDDGDDSDLESDPDSHRKRLKQLPAYKLAYQVGLEVHRVLQPFVQKLDLDAALDDAGERLMSAFGNVLIPSAKMANANGLGYSDDVLCGHIVVLRKGLGACITALEDIEWLKQQQHVPPAIAQQCLDRLAAVREAMEARIAELRSRVWWD